MRTGWPSRPPRPLTSAIQARDATGISATLAPIGPEPVPNEPSTVSLLAAAGGTVAGVAPPGAASVPEAPPGRPVRAGWFDAGAPEADGFCAVARPPARSEAAPGERATEAPTFAASAGAAPPVGRAPSVGRAAP